jgi:NitT/TauT family transport system permease protein
MKKIFIPLLTIVLFIFFWELLVFFKIIDGQFFPPPHLFVGRAVELLTGDFLSQDLGPSLLRLIQAIMISLPLGLLFGIFSGTSRLLDQIINPMLAFTYPLPKVAIFPLMLLLFGIGDFSKVMLIAIGIFYLIYINVRSSTQKLLQSPLMDIVSVYEIKGWNYYYHFLLKGIRRDFYIGLKSSLGYGLILVVVSELSVSRNGIGHFIWQSWDQFRVNDMYAGIFILSFIGFLISSFLDYLIEKSISL